MRVIGRACLWAAVPAVAACAVSGPGSAESATGGVSLELSVRGEESLAVLYRVKTDGTLEFGGGLDARFNRITWTSRLTDEEITELRDLLIRHEWYTRAPVSTGEPQERVSLIRFWWPGGSGRYKVRGRSPDVAPIQDLLERVTRRRLVPELETLPKPTSPQALSDNPTWRRPAAASLGGVGLHRRCTKASPPSASLPSSSSLGLWPTVGLSDRAWRVPLVRAKHAPYNLPMRGTSLIGLLVSLAILLVLGLVMAKAINKSLTGAGSTLPGTVASHSDLQNLYAIFQSLSVQSQVNEGRFLVPSELTRRRDPADDTTANLFSAMIAQQYAAPKQLYSANEQNPVVWWDEDYDYYAYDPAADRHWDPAFAADLEVESNTSFAHVPLYGERLRRHWQFAVGYRTPMLGNRGPKDGVADPSSYTYGLNGKWAGHVVFGDGHIEFVETFTPANVFLEQRGTRRPDNLFRMEDGPDGRDAILTFTKTMTDDGPVVQHD